MVTQKQAATAMNVSVRSVANATTLWKTGREDLCAQVEAGTLNLAQALRLAAGGSKEPPAVNRLDRLIRAWNAAPEDVRIEFMRRIIDAGK
jgi:hypothetical protein